ncbi:MAG: (Fe-S)-binding protein [SAR324 cluster bacterium]|nr:(Fe-S)-binding protein [SAR324 cluster bacterium]
MNRNKRVTLFIQCLVDQIYPEVGEAMVTVFQKLGISLDCPTAQTCCGQSAYNSGYKKVAKTAAKRFIEIFEKAEVIVCPSGSCVDMVRNHYPTLFKNEPDWRLRAESVAGKTFEFTEYLVDVLKVEDLGASFTEKLTYHDSCHLLRNIGVKDQPRKLIAKVAGAELVEMENSDKCCGFGGTFSIKYPGISTAILDEKLDNIMSSGATTVVGCDVGCLMNIEGRLSRKNLPIKTMHIAQLLVQ